MSREVPYIKKEERKKILLLSDDMRMHSGIATMTREFVLKTAGHFNWFQVGAAMTHPERGKMIDLSEDVKNLTGIEDPDIKLIPYDGYGDAPLIRHLMKTEKPDAIFIFTDPRYWIWLFDIEREIRSKIPIIWLNIWDNYPAPLYNKPYYNSVDGLFAISKQTKLINELVLGEDASSKVIKYIPHGIDPNAFFPLDESVKEFAEFRKGLFREKEIDFVVFWNSRNINRKRPADVIASYKEFCDLIGKEKAKRCALVMHTEVVNQAGTDLRAVKNAICDPEYINVFFSIDRLTPSQMNFLYNVSDVTLLVSSNEGWGLSLTESMMSGKMIIAAVTGGMQDQLRFEDAVGKWVEFDANFPSNHRGTYRKCGKWAIPVFPSNISIMGSPQTPYIYDDRVDNGAVARAILKVYEMDPEQRRTNGLAGREWALSEEAKMSAEAMSYSIMEGIEECLETFIPRPRYEIIKIEDRANTLITHKLTDY